VSSDVTDQLLIRFSAFIRYCRKKWEYNEDNTDTIKNNTETLIDTSKEVGLK
jgi:hypothetical protein